MSDSASGSVDKSVQVKLVLLGNLTCFGRHLVTRNVSLKLTLLHPHLPGEAAVGKSSVVLRFVCQNDFRSYGCLLNCSFGRAGF